ncbi:MAG: MauE/DoxX family redox-associated membrane protein [Acidimicrobiales bacterium]
MTIVGTAASVALGAVFTIAAVTKLAAPTWTADAAALGVPRWLARPVPVVEVVLAATLVAGIARPVPALGAVVLLVVFSALVAQALRRGRRPVCACFGRWSARPISAWTLARNGVLLALAAVAALG